MPKQYRKVPVVIEAELWDGSINSAKQIMEWMKNHGTNSCLKPYSYPVPIANMTIMIDTLEGAMHASKGDFIIKGVKDEFYPCKSEIFLLTYEPIEEVS